MWASFGKFEIEMTKKQAASASHPGPCDADVAVLVKCPKIARQLRKIPPADIAAELKQYGVWSEEDLKDHEWNLKRIVWIAAGDITDNIYQKD